MICMPGGDSGHASVSRMPEVVGSVARQVCSDVVVRLLACSYLTIAESRAA